jgi:acetolactate synthase-1/2/3 large subunit
VVREFIEFDGPAFLEVIIDPDAGVYPMVGPGQSYEEMITGDFIESRSKADTKTPDATGMF